MVAKAPDRIKVPAGLACLDLEESPACTESAWENAIIDRLRLERGKGLLCKARQKRLCFDHRHVFVDLVCCNRLLPCYVLIDLKRGALTHQDPDQRQMYVNYFGRYVTTNDELPTVGILPGDRKNDAVVQLTLPADANLYTSKYLLYLPSQQELAAQIASVHREHKRCAGRSAA